MVNNESNSQIRERNLTMEEDERCMCQRANIEGDGHCYESRFRIRLQVVT